ncbi:MAG: TIR domain-containing protein, partial [Deltaproteobacteria bacterium]|nr:TIR domain-containing protein [Deltaproteobacteria bacterium]
MPELHRYRIFISHAWSYNEDYYRLIKYLDEAPSFLYANYSVPKHDPAEESLKEALRRQIRPVEVVLIVAGMYANSSDWIQFEM